MAASMVGRLSWWWRHFHRRDRGRLLFRDGAASVASPSARGSLTTTFFKVVRLARRMFRLTSQHLTKDLVQSIADQKRSCGERQAIPRMLTMTTMKMTAPVAVAVGNTLAMAMERTITIPTIPISKIWWSRI